MENVPIVTEVTHAQLLALIAANGLNEGLQYKVTDKGWLLTATSVNTFIHIGNAPYKIYCALMSQQGQNAPTVTILDNSIGEIVWTYNAIGQYIGTLEDAFPLNKTVGRYDLFDNGELILISTNPTNNSNISVCSKVMSTMVAYDDILYNAYIEIKVYC